jgi:hypothetical protein
MCKPVSAPDLMRRYLELARAGDWESALALVGERMVEVWIFEQDQYAVDELMADLRFDE